MMPPVAPPAPSTVPSAPSDSGSNASDGRDPAQRSVPFDALLALLGASSPAATAARAPSGAPPVPTASEDGTDHRRTADDPAPGSLDALVAALAQQLGGVAPAVSRPVESTGGEAAAGHPADRRMVAAPPIPSEPDVPVTAGVAPATDGRPHLRSAVAALAQSGDSTGSPSPVAGLAQRGDGTGSPSPVAALANGVVHDGPGPSPAAAADHDRAERSDSTVSAAAPDAAPDRLSSNPHGGRVAQPSAPRSDEAAGAMEDDPTRAVALTASGAPAPAPAAPASETRRPSGPAVSADRASPFAAPAPVGSAGAPAEAPMVSSSSDTPPATPATVADQIVSAVVPLHGRGDGRHEITLELRPESLGSIRVELSVEHQTVHLTLHAAEPATGGLLSAALPDLRSALADAGLTAGHIGVGPGGQGPGHGRSDRPGADGDEPGRRRRGATGGGDRSPAGAVPIARPAPAGRIDVLL